VCIEKFDLGIGKEWLLNVGLTDERTNSSDKLYVELTNHVRKCEFTDESCDELTDVTRVAIKFAWCGICLDVDEGVSTFVLNIKGTAGLSVNLGTSTKHLELLLQMKRKGTKKKADMYQ